MNPSSVESVVTLKQEWHKAATDGDADAFNSFQGPLDSLLTPNRNTLLHVHLATPIFTFKTIGCVPYLYCGFSKRKKAANQISTEFVQQILDKCPSLLRKTNAKGEIPLHVVARFGHGNIVQLLVQTAEAQEKDLENGIDPEKQMVGLTDNEGDTALHIAVRYGHVDVVRELLRADPQLSYCVNSSQETPLYIAARREYDILVAMILDTPDAPDHIHQGPCGRTALHAAALAAAGNKYDGISRTTMVILSKGKNLVKARDENGRTPLHYAAHFGLPRMVELLLECDESAACEIDEDEMTALHMAARKGHLQVMWKIIRCCPECCEIVDKRGWNFLHFAAVSLPRVTLHRFLRADRFRRLLHEKDIHGNTPLQVLAASRESDSDMARIFNDDRETVRSENLDSKKKKHILELLKEVGHGEVAGSSVHPVRQNKFDDESTVKAREVHAVVSALVATAAFAAAFTLPGGYKNDKGDKDLGSAILSHERAFVAFVIADSVAMISALLAMSFNYYSAFAKAAGAGTNYKLLTFNLMVYSGLLGQVALVVAFVTGLYAVLKSALTLAIATCIIVLFFFIAHHFLVGFLFSRYR